VHDLSTQVSPERHSSSERQLLKQAEPGVMGSRSTSPQAYPTRHSVASVHVCMQMRVPSTISTQLAPAPQTSAGIPTVPQSKTEQ
jgi:hypothetical protein